MAFKMATGSGKTVVMAMLIAWQALNKQANPQDRRFSDKFLIVTPGITIRDRLRVLLPNDPQNYYRQLDLLTPEQIDRLQSATIVITNFHAFIRREKIQAASLTKKVLAGGEDDDRFKETPAEMVRRVCRDFGNARRTSSCSTTRRTTATRRRPRSRQRRKRSTRTSAQLARQDLEEARVWLTGLQAVQEKLGIRAVFDLSATPFFLKGSGYREGTLFPWVVSDFGLMDAIESGIVKIPRVPERRLDDRRGPDVPRPVAPRARRLPRKGLKDTPIDGRADHPQGARRRAAHPLRRLRAQLRRLGGRGHGHAAGLHRRLLEHGHVEARRRLDQRLEKELPDGPRSTVPGNLPLFSNVRDGGLLLDRPNTLLVDSAQLDRGDALDPAFRKAAHAEIETSSAST
jgi:type III restriction enzyme